MKEKETVVVSNNVVVNRETGARTQSFVYHTENCGNAPKKSSKHYYEVDKEIAVNLGKVQCKACRDMCTRRTALEQVNRHVKTYLEKESIEKLTEHLPSYLELRIYAHSGDRRSPLKAWSSLENHND